MRVYRIGEDPHQPKPKTKAEGPFDDLNRLLDDCIAAQEAYFAKRKAKS